jgi:hypothetical protein
MIFPLVIAAPGRAVPTYPSSTAFRGSSVELSRQLASTLFKIGFGAIGLGGRWPGLAKWWGISAFLRHLGRLNS